MQNVEEAPPQSRSYGPWLVALGAALWGTESIWRIPLNRIFDPEIIVFYEHALLVLVAIPIILIQRKMLKQIPWSAYGYLIFSGVAGSAVGTVFFTMALRPENGSNASVVNVLLNIQPLFSTTVACLLFKDRLSKQFFLWAPVAIFAGMVLSIEHPSELLVSLKAAGLTKGTGFALLCAFFWGLSTVAGRGTMMKMPTSLASALRFVIGFVAMAVIVIARGKMGWHALAPAALQGQVGYALMLLILLCVLSGGTPTFIYFLGLKYTRASTAGYFEMMQTLAALLVTWAIPTWFPNPLVLPAPLAVHQMVAGGILIIAVVMVQRAQHGVEKPSPSQVAG